MILRIASLMGIIVCSIGCANQPQSTVKDGRETANDLPNLYLSCGETVDGADVLDGAKSLLILKDQFGQYSANVIQRDQFMGDSNLATFLSLQRTAVSGSEIFTGAENGSSMTFDVTSENGHLVGNLILETINSPNRINIEVRCTRPSPAVQPTTPTQAHVLWKCEGMQGNATISAEIRKEVDGDVSGVFTHQTSNSNGSVHTHSWFQQGMTLERCGEGFSPCDSIVKADDIAGSKNVDVFVNYNNALSTSGFGHLNLVELLVVRIDADVTCTRSL